MSLPGPRYLNGLNTQEQGYGSYSQGFYNVIGQTNEQVIINTCFVIERLGL